MAVAWSNEGQNDSPELRRNRPLVLARDRRECQLRLPGCVLVASDVDHRANRKSGGLDSMDNLQAVCLPCHKRKTHGESRAAWKVNRRALIHRDHKRKHPGYR
ncbi:HNH endonuclease signature motif containing protein [Nocardia sp. NPDC050435]|uniref:HNH endonuclease n=1 Tax=Nocardia sp. NPDC050435 TaxID=3155040 RepID=UPI0033D8D006